MGAVVKKDNTLGLVRELLFDGREDSGGNASSFEQSSIAQGWQMVDAYVADLGISGAATQCAKTDHLSDNELLAKALEERMHARGVM